MTHRAQLAILALLIILAILAFFFWPAPAKSDVPIVPSRIPASEFEAIRSADPLASGQASISADPQPRTLTPAAMAPATVSPSASHVTASTPVRITETPARESSAGSAASKAGRPVPAATSAPLRGKFGVVVGTASWYCLPGRSACTRGYPAAGMYAAAGPALRVGDWRGRVVTVTAGGRQVAVKLVDVCQCPGGRVLDLYSSAFSRLAPLSRGVVEVSVRW